ncbi:MAG: metal ABC transporter ATP-binding protein [Candidatus Micrarchaeia archaeon]
MSQKQEKIVEFSGVSFSFGSQPVLDNASFELRRGDFVGMIGPNGAGKTTLVKLMLGLLKPGQGTIKLFGKELAEFRDWKKIGYVPQKATSFDPDFPATVLEAASMGRFASAGLMNQLSAADNKAVEDSLRRTGMLSMAGKRIGELSGGQQQRVFIARALASEPELLILDEPTVGVDAEAQHDFYELLGSLNKKMKMTLVLISHDVGMVTKRVNRLACVNRTVRMHEISEGFDSADLRCAYESELGMVPHHH